jgi:parvulin-like peptidyl-prolyl isomerase
MKLKHILVQHRHEAEDLILLLSQGSDFSQLATKFSKCSSASAGGELGELKPGRFVEEFEESALLLQVLQYTSQPVRTRFGYHLIYRYE